MAAEWSSESSSVRSQMSCPNGAMNLIPAMGYRHCAPNGAEVAMVSLARWAR